MKNLEINKDIGLDADFGFGDWIDAEHDDVDKTKKK